MSRLRPTTGRAAAAYPEVPVRYHRPFLRCVAGLFLMGESVLTISLTYFPEGRGDDVDGGDWYLNLAFLVMLGSVYLYLASSLVLTRTHLVINNPLRRVAIPLAQIERAEEGSNLRIVTAYRSFLAAGVEAANVQIASGRYGTQQDLAELINHAAADARSAAAEPEEPARYRFAWPDALFLVFAVIHLVNAAVLLVNDGPLPL
ncbi:hypothetical protein [Kribbella sp. NPDC051770]|uniref:hypothetical protein n=1 Tax=Kribbella sp. NPDC051770 TaxID=3155413 RepID=UPI00341A7A42